jgi:hypothetical protein
LYLAAREVFEEVKERIPNGYRPLKKSLEMALIHGLPDNTAGYVIRSVPKQRAIKKAAVDTTVLYVTARANSMRPVPKIVSILEEHSPWTADTLPIQPDPKVADVTSRRVSERVVDKVRKMRERDRMVWKRKFNEVGAREMRQGGLVKATRQMRAIPDTAFESVRLEFGLGGFGAHPHWRPSLIRLAVRGGAAMIARKRVFVRAMTDPDFRGWLSWPRPVTERAMVSELKRYVPFQKKLGVRVKK